MHLTQEHRDEIRALYLQQVPYAKIVKRFGCSESNFWNVVRGLQFQVREEYFQYNVTRLNTLTEAQKGWIAGIVDGEGYIGLVENNPPDRKRSLTPRIDVTSTTRIMQTTLRRLVGGCVGQPRDGKPNEKPQHAWSLWAVETVGPFLQVITPYLIVKRRVAHVVLDFCERRRAVRGQPYDARDWRALKRVRELNKRGRS